MKNIYLYILLISLPTSFTSAQIAKPIKPGDYLTMHWKNIATKMPSDWYGSDEAKMVADSVLKYQTDIGGWAKNSGFHSGGVKQEEWKRIVKYGIGATFDNDATITEMKFLTKIYAKQKDERYHEAFMKAFNYIFIAQYSNGGWPQFYPYRKKKSDYSSHITYNDNAMINVMNLLSDIIDGNEMYEAMQIDDTMKVNAKKAFDNGVECILKTQIVVNRKPTVWCAQHDEFTLVPAKARSYELESFSGKESAGITLLLMNIDNPSKEIIAAVNGAVQWFEDHKIEDIKIEWEINRDGNKDRIVVEDETAPPLWGRFCDLETGKPFFCSRDGIRKNSLAEISYNRRNGYGWYTDAPQEVLNAYPEWEKRISNQL